VIILLDFCKNAAFFGNGIKNLPLTTTTTTGDGVVVHKLKDPAYLLAQYVYTIWLILMMIKAVIGFRANLKVRKKKKKERNEAAFALMNHRRRGSLQY